MIIVTGATGQLGRTIVKLLVERVPPYQVGVSVRDLAKAADLEARGVRVRHGDFDDLDSLRHAFEGATQVLVVSSNVASYGGDPLAQHRTAIEAARAVGAQRIVYTSHMGCSASSAFPPMRDHAATEGMLRESGLAWTALRNGFYGASGIALMGDALETGVIEAPADGKVSWTAHADLSEAAAIVLAEEGRFNGPTPPLTASQALDLADIAGIATEVSGRPVTRKILSEDEMRAKVAARGAPRHSVEIVMGLYKAAGDGEFEPVDPTLERLIGRPPMTMRDLVKERVAG